MQILIRKHKTELTEELAKFVERRLHFSLGRFNGKVRSVQVSLDDINGPRGGVDQECRLTVHTGWRTRIVIQERDADMHAAVTRAAERAGRTLERQASLRYGAPRPVSTIYGD